MSFTNAYPILSKYEGVPVVLASDNKFKDGELVMDNGDGTYSSITVYQPQAAPMCYEQLNTTASLSYIKKYEMHKINPWPAYMVYNRDQPTIDLNKGSKMFDIRFVRLNPKREEDTWCLN